jgi:hypothetical protein
MDFLFAFFDIFGFFGSSEVSAARGRNSGSSMGVGPISMGVGPISMGVGPIS